MTARRSDRPTGGTPLGRYAEWYEALSPDLRTHLAAHLFHAGDPSELHADLVAWSGDAARDAERAAELAARTDQVLADPAIRDRWTGEAALAGLDGDAHEAPRRTIRERAVTRSVEWMRAAEQWALLRESGLAGRRIERWRAKRAEPERRPE